MNSRQLVGFLVTAIFIFRPTAMSRHCSDRDMLSISLCCTGVQCVEYRIAVHPLPKLHLVEFARSTCPRISKRG